jgi:hypothetical protein
MAELKCSDGTVVQISTETEAELRKAFESKHVWKHGDVFKNGSGRMMYLNPKHGKEQMVWVDRDLEAVCSIERYREDCIFLFNIKDKL